MGKTIFISAGHSDSDPGAVSAAGLREEDLARDLRNAIRSELIALGSEPLTDGDNSQNQPLTEAVKIARRNSKGINIEIHFNAGPPTASGIEALCYSNHKALSQAVCLAIAEITKTKVRGDNGWKPSVSGQHARLAFCEAGGIILEVEFISNTQALTVYRRNVPAIAKSVAAVLHQASGAGSLVPKPMELVKK